MFSSNKGKQFRDCLNELFEEYYTSEDFRSFIQNQRLSPSLHQLMVGKGLVGMVDIENETDTGIRQSMVAAEESGKTVLTYPLIEANIGLAILNTNKQRFASIINAIESGEKIVTVAWRNLDGKGTRIENGIQLDGTYSVAPFAKDADYILVAVDFKDGEESRTIAILDVAAPGIKISATYPVDDPTYPLYTVKLTQYQVLAASNLQISIDQLHKFLCVTRLLKYAELIGCSEGMVKEIHGSIIGREGQPIFEGIKDDIDLKIASMKAMLEQLSMELNCNQMDLGLSSQTIKRDMSTVGLDIYGMSICLLEMNQLCDDSKLGAYFSRIRQCSAALSASSTVSANFFR